MWQLLILAVLCFGETCPTETPTSTPTLTVTPTFTPTPTVTPTFTPTLTVTPTFTPILTVTPTFTVTAEITDTPIPTGWRPTDIYGNPIETLPVAGGGKFYIDALLIFVAICILVALILIIEVIKLMLKGASHDNR